MSKLVKPRILPDAPCDQDYFFRDLTVPKILILLLNSLLLLLKLKQRSINLEIR